MAVWTDEELTRRFTDLNTPGMNDPKIEGEKRNLAHEILREFEQFALRVRAVRAPNAGLDYESEEHTAALNSLQQALLHELDDILS